MMSYYVGDDEEGKSLELDSEDTFSLFSQPQ